MLWQEACGSRTQVRRASRNMGGSPRTARDCRRISQTGTRAWGRGSHGESSQSIFDASGYGVLVETCAANLEPPFAAIHPLRCGRSVVLDAISEVRCGLRKRCY